MSTLLTIQPRTVHVWLVELLHFTSEELVLQKLLAPDEVERAMRFHFSMHRQRFIIARGLLRKTLSLYTAIAPDKIVFSYGAQGKPYLRDTNYFLKFNVSHSADLAIFALTTVEEIGVDIQKIKPRFKEEVAKRFFSPEDYTELMTLPPDARIKSFYQLWSNKEALIKARGEGLFARQSDLPVDLLQHIHVHSLSVPDGYQAAVATAGSIENIIYHRCLE